MSTITIKKDLLKAESNVIEDEALESEITEQEQRLVRWIIKMTDTTVTEADYQACERWLAQYEVHRKLFNDYMAMWNHPAFESALQTFQTRQKPGIIQKMP